MFTNFLLVATGGFFGSILRLFISKKMNKHFVGTWIANITGSIMLGLLLKFYLTNSLAHHIWLLGGVGFCGAYTTFSTFGTETIQLFIAKKYATTFYYVISSFIVSIGLVFIILM